MDEQVTMTAEAIELAIESGDSQIISDYMQGNIKVGTPDDTESVVEVTQSEIEVPSETEPEVNPISREELIADFVSPEPTTVPTETVVESDEIIELRKKVKLLEAAKVEEPTETEKPVRPIADEITLIDEDPDDVQFESAVTRNNRTILEDLRSKIGSNTSDAMMNEIMAKLSKLERADRKRQDIIEDDRAKNAQEQAQTKLFSEIERLQESSGTFKTDKPINMVFAEYMSFKERIADYIGSTNPAAIEKAVHSAMIGSGDRDQAFKQSIVNAGIDMPSNGETYMKLVEIVDLKNGQVYNKSTGGYDKIEDEYGNQVNQRTLGDAFKLSTYSNQLADAERRASSDIQRKLESINGGAQTIPSSDITDASEQQLISSQEANDILDMKPSVIRNSPELTKKYNKILAQLDL